MSTLHSDLSIAPTAGVLSSQKKCFLSVSRRYTHHAANYTVILYINT